MIFRSLPGRRETAHFTTAELRSSFLIDDLFQPGEIRLAGTDLDRAIVGGAIPLSSPLPLPVDPELRADFFTQRREVGIINLGGAGSVQVDEEKFSVGTRECLYVGRGNHSITFASDDASFPAVFYIVSYPAHAEYPTRLAKASDANIVSLGSKELANERKIYQYIHENGIKSCQLVLGYTELASGSVWNTMPPHTHTRRSEVYCYFDIPEGQRVLHLMGEPQETRSIWMANRNVVLSPAWSIHSGAGTSAYRFVWAMGGENQRFDDMDGVPIGDLR